MNLEINNSRYLLLHWAKVKYLSSKVLGRVIWGIVEDWALLFGYKPVLVETFVGVDKFFGTSYKAANWIYLGRTKGKGRRGMEYFCYGIQKDVYAYKLTKDFGKELLG